jgi:hypothetical protein
MSRPNTTCAKRKRRSFFKKIINKTSSINSVEVASAPEIQENKSAVGGPKIYKASPNDSTITKSLLNLLRTSISGNIKIFRLTP